MKEEKHLTYQKFMNIKKVDGWEVLKNEKKYFI